MGGYTEGACTAHAGAAVGITSNNWSDVVVSCSSSEGNGMAFWWLSEVLHAAKRVSSQAHYIA